jgi:hypothetical protein
MPIWCPKCNAMLAEGQKKCPVCGARVGRGGKDKLGCSEIISLSAYVMGIALIPIVFMLVISGLCILFWQ